MKLKESKGMSLIVFTIILAVLLIVAGGIIIYLISDPVKEKIETQTQINGEELSASEIVETKISNAEALSIGNDLFNKQGKIIYKVYTDGNDYKDTVVEINKTLKGEFYSLLTENAIKEIETKCEYKEKDGKFYYDIAWFDLCSIFGDTDVGRKELVVKSLDVDKIVFDVLIYGIIETEGQQERLEYTFENAFKIVRFNEEWLIDSIAGNKRENVKPDNEEINLVSINDEQNISAEGKIREYISKTSVVGAPIEIEYIVSGENKRKLEINGKEVYVEKNIIDIKRLSVAYEINTFVLFEDGTVGKFLIDIQNNKYAIVKVENCENIVRIQELVFEHENENSGIDFVLVAIDNDGKIVALDTYGIVARAS